MGTDKITGYVNPDGSGEGNWSQSVQPEAPVCPECGAPQWSASKTPNHFSYCSGPVIEAEARAASQERPPMATPSHAAQVIDVLTQVKAALMTDPILSSNLLVTDQIAVVIARLSRSVTSPEDE